MTGVDGSTTTEERLREWGTPVKVADVQVTVSPVGEGTAPESDGGGSNDGAGIDAELGDQTLDTHRSHGTVSLFVIRIENGSEEPVRLPGMDDIGLPGERLRSQAAHHFRIEGSFVPSYFRLASAYGDAPLQPGDSVTGLVGCRTEETADATSEAAPIVTRLEFERESTVVRWGDAGVEESTPSPDDTARSGTEPTATTDGEIDDEDEAVAETSEHERSSTDTDDARSAAPDERETEDAGSPGEDHANDAVTDSSTEDTDDTDDTEPDPTPAPQCPGCGATVSPSFDFCGECGESLSE